MAWDAPYPRQAEPKPSFEHMTTCGVFVQVCLSADCSFANGAPLQVVGFNNFCTTCSLCNKSITLLCKIRFLDVLYKIIQGQSINIEG